MKKRDEIISNMVSKLCDIDIIEYNYDHDYCDYDEWYDDYDDYDIYDYIPNNSKQIIITKQRGVPRLGGVGRIGAMIDMNSIYSKEILRDKKINQLLGLEYNFGQPSFGDLVVGKIRNK